MHLDPWKFFTSFAYDFALDLSEVASLGRHGWYWRLCAAARRRYWRDTAIRVVEREAAASGLAAGQLVYGETPPLAFLSMLARVGVESSDVVVDLGCGRGLALLAASLHHGVGGVGLDVIPTFIARANDMARTLGVSDRVHFEAGDFFDADLSAGTIFYAASTTFSSATMASLADHVATQTPPGVRFICLGQPLPAPWQAIGQGRLPMSWGWSDVFFHRKVGDLTL